jgi:hypothetical protein
MPIVDLRPGAGSGGGGGVTSVNGQTDVVILTPANIGAEPAVVPVQVNCLDNAIEQIVIGASSNEVYELTYCLKLNISGKERNGNIRLGFDGAVIFDEEYSYNGSDISGVEISANENAGNLRIAVDLTSVGEDTKFRYVLNKLTAIV